MGFDKVDRRRIGSPLLWARRHGSDSTNKTSQVQPSRGEIYLTALDQTLGREIQKTRPALIIQNDISNRLSGIAFVSGMEAEPVPAGTSKRSVAGWLNIDSMSRGGIEPPTY